jgi:CelD/BcsL family acetyltransferase involved in cellulose biosynthesis
MRSCHWPNLATQAIINKLMPMKYQFTLESFDSIYDTWRQLYEDSTTAPIFTSPEWSKIWWQQLGSGAKLYLGAVRQGNRVIGIAPLLIKGDAASFIGSVDVCDYLDFVVATGSEDAFFGELLNNLRIDGVLQLELTPLRPESIVRTSLINIAPKYKWQVSCFPEDMTVELNLPASWEEYLQLLSGKQRHELNRKLRRLNEEGDLDHRTVTDANRPDIDMFLRLFRESRQDKAAFLTEQMESFFRSIARAMAEQKLLRLNILELNNKAVAATMCFDYKDTVYLYNSGYEPDYRWLSVGVISKALCIKAAIERHKKRFDFLKGDEAYKYHLGGQEQPLFSCSLSYES